MLRVLFRNGLAPLLPREASCGKELMRRCVNTKPEFEEVRIDKDDFAKSANEFAKEKFSQKFRQRIEKRTTPSSDTLLGHYMGTYISNLLLSFDLSGIPKFTDKDLADAFMGDIPVRLYPVSRRADLWPGYSSGSSCMPGTSRPRQM